MFKKIVISSALSIAALFVGVSNVNAQSVDASPALARMDAIIAEMQALKAEFAKLVASIGATQGTPTVLGTQSSSVLTQSLEYGETNSDIEKIQRLLATDPEIYPYGVASGFFGPKTQEAIRNLQARFGLDTVGVIGPQTKALLELFLNAYPNENYPADVLKQKPQVQGVSTTVTPSVPATTIQTVSADNPASSIIAEIDRGEAEVDIRYKNGNKRSLFVTGDDEDEVIEAIAGRTVLTEAQVREVIEFDSPSRSSRSSDADEDDAEDALDAADDAIDDADDEIDEADEDGEDVDWAKDTLDEAEELLEEAEDAYDDEDYDEAVDKAEEAEELAEKAEDRIGEEEKDSKGEKGDPDEVEHIDADIVDEDETEVVVEYEDGNEYEFTIEEDKKDEIIEEVADELDMDEDDVEDIIEFDFGDIDEINVLVEDDEAEVTVEFETGVTLRFTIDEDDEDEMIEEIADELDEDEDDVEDVIDFDYN